MTNHPGLQGAEGMDSQNVGLSVLTLGQSGQMGMFGHPNYISEGPQGDRAQIPTAATFALLHCLLAFLPFPSHVLHSGT